MVTVPSFPTAIASLAVNSTKWTVKYQPTPSDMLTESSEANSYQHPTKVRKSTHELASGTKRVVFHSATRIHTPKHRLDAFDQAITSIGDGGPMYWLSVEDAPDPRPDPARHGAALRLRRPDGSITDLAIVEGHLNWIEPLDI